MKINRCKYRKMIVLSSALLMFMKTVLSDMAITSTVFGIRGGSAVLTCISPLNGPTLPTISWIKIKNRTSSTIVSSVSGKAYISTSLQHRVKLHGANLTIRSLMIFDEGIYVCEVIAVSKPLQTKSLILRVTAAPFITACSIVSHQIETSGKYVAATCSANAGKPRAKIRWMNQRGELQDARVVVTLAADGSYNVESFLLLRPGLLGRPVHSTLPISPKDKTKNFTCQVAHPNLLNSAQTIRRISANILYPPVVHISLRANRLTCHPGGNPTPSIKWVLPSGLIFLDQASIDLDQLNSKDGHYVCIAESTLKPTAIATLQVNMAKDLPLQFRTLTRLELSLPTTAAGYEIECSADLLEPSVREDYFTRLFFRWNKNGKAIKQGVYNISSQVARLNSIQTRITSTLRFADVVQERDDALFQCFLSTSPHLTGFLTTVEKAIRVMVDYSPVSATIIMESGTDATDAAVTEGAKLLMTCFANSVPSSTYDWYFNGLKTFTGERFMLDNVVRKQAGVYHCVAYNYIPGSAHAHIAITVRFPPSEIVISKSSEDILTCSSKSGSVPPPVYTWIYPNHTRTTRNSSNLKLSQFLDDRRVPYICLVSNNLGIISNATYIHSAAASVGALSVPHFVVVVVVCILLATTLLLAIFANFLHKCSITKNLPEQTAASFSRVQNEVQSSSSKDSVLENEYVELKSYPVGLSSNDIAELAGWKKLIEKPRLQPMPSLKKMNLKRYTSFIQNGNNVVECAVLPDVVNRTNIHQDTAKQLRQKTSLSLQRCPENRFLPEVQVVTDTKSLYNYAKTPLSLPTQQDAVYKHKWHLDTAHRECTENMYPKNRVVQTSLTGINTVSSNSIKKKNKSVQVKNMRRRSWSLSALCLVANIPSASGTSSKDTLYKFQNSSNKNLFKDFATTSGRYSETMLPYKKSNTGVNLVYFLKGSSNQRSITLV